MEGASREPRLETYFAPAPRANGAAIARSGNTFFSDVTAAAMLQGMPDAAFVLNPQRQVVAANELGEALSSAPEVDARLLDGQSAPPCGLRPGEAVGCRHAKEGPAGCGTARACRHCGATLAILTSLERGGRVQQECRIHPAAAERPALDINVVATPLTIGGEHFVVMALRDISAEKRRRVLERVFFHDVLNTATAVQGIGDLLVTESVEVDLLGQLHGDLRRLTRAMVEEIRGQRDLLAAESGDLEVLEESLALQEVFDDLRAAYQHAGRSGQRLVLQAPPPSVHFRSDPSVLRRVLGNLLKNAFEATPPDGEVGLVASVVGANLRFEVRNPTVMSDAVQSQIFKRSFSTKAGRGRGLGTYGAWLLTRRYLRGSIAFRSNRREGTVFWLNLPLEW